MTIRLDYSNMMAPPSTAASPTPSGRRAARDFADGARRVSSELRAGDARLPRPARRPRAAPIRRSTSSTRAASGPVLDDVVVLGIGGSALGPIALRTALRPPQWNMLDDAARGGSPRLHVLDNVDPANDRGAAGAARPRAHAVRRHVEVRRHGRDDGAVPGRARAGSTQRSATRATEHLVFVTDPEKGALRAARARRGHPGARHSRRTSAGGSACSRRSGMLPAALIGIDIGGAARRRGRHGDALRAGELRDEPRRRLRGAPVARRHAARPARSTCSCRTPTAARHRRWFVQLWAESLGKHRPDGDAGVGPTPLAALGATDQHSQVQLFMEGPADKTVTFVARRRARARRRRSRALHGDVPELAYLGGHTLGELLDIEQRATAGALARARPAEHDDSRSSASTPWHVGGLIMLLEIATAYAGQLYGVDAFDQPGVELGKQFTYAMLGRAGRRRGATGMGPAAQARSAADASDRRDASRGLATPPAPGELHVHTRASRTSPRPPTGGCTFVRIAMLDLDTLNGLFGDAVDGRGRPRHRAPTRRRSRRRRWTRSSARPSSATAMERDYARWLIWEIGQAVGVQPGVDPRPVHGARPRRDRRLHRAGDQRARHRRTTRRASIFRTAIKLERRRVHPRDRALGDRLHRPAAGRVRRGDAGRRAARRVPRTGVHPGRPLPGQRARSSRSIRRPKWTP